MPKLIDLKTSLKDLKFGHDRIGGGNSGQPYQTFPIPDDKATPLITDFWQNNNTNLDYPIRGGSLIGSGFDMSTLNGQIDRVRIGKFLSDPNRGRAFIEKQVGLQRSNPLIETGNADNSAVLSTFNNILGRTFNSILNAFGSNVNLSSLTSFTGAGGNNQVYNRGKNMLAQVLSSGTGVHIERTGRIPFDTNAQYYTQVVGQQLYLGDVSKINRLLLLQSSKLSSTISGNQYTNLDPNAVILGISPRNLILFDYPGGPNSTYGIGNTVIRRAVNSSDAYNLTKNNNTSDLFPGVFTMSYEQIMNTKNNTASQLHSNGRDRNSTILNDFRQVTGAPDGSQVWDKSESVDYRFYVNGVDNMNRAKLAKLTDKDPFENVKPGSESDDIIKFGFECMSNDVVGFSTPLFFRAFLTNGISDNNNAELNSFKYMGRGETFYTYQGFNRSISFGFKIVAFSSDELRPLYNKLNYLVSQVYPDYSNAGYMRAPIVKVTIGDYLYRVPGFLESVNLTVDNASPWELTSYSQANPNLGQLPKAIDVSVSFKPIFDELPRRSVPSNDPNQAVGSAIVGRRGFLNVTTGSIATVEPTSTTVSVPKNIARPDFTNLTISPKLVV